MCASCTLIHTNTRPHIRMTISDGKLFRAIALPILYIQIALCILVCGRIHGRVKRYDDVSPRSLCASDPFSPKEVTDRTNKIIEMDRPSTIITDPAWFERKETLDELTAEDTRMYTKR